MADRTSERIAAPRPVVLGRDAELATLATRVAAAAHESSVTTITGPAGAGKTTLLRLLALDIDADGRTVLRSTPTAAESGLAYAALGDLLAGVTDLSMLPPVRRLALERALLRSAGPGVDGDRDGNGVELDARVIGHAVVDVLAHLSAAAPVAILIDDVQWLDAASAAALSFASRRLPASGVVVVAGRRSDHPGPPPLGDVIELAPLDDAAVAALVASHARRPGGALSQRTQSEIVARAAGNPLFAVELSRAAHERPARTDGVTIVPSSLVLLLDERFGAVPEDVAAALATVALMSRADLAGARELGILEALAAAERDGIIDTGRGAVEFVHPLFGAAVLARTAPLQQRRIHARLAQTTRDPLDADRHAALAAEGPDGALAARLSAGAIALTGRGALAHAADLAVLAARLSPADDPDRDERCVAAASLAFRAGESGLAIEMLDAVGTSPTEPLRVRTSMVRARVEFSAGSANGAQTAAADALRHCTTDAELIEVHSVMARTFYDDFALAEHHAEIALDLARRTAVPDDVRISALIAKATSTLMTGGGLDRALLDEAVSLESAVAGSVAFAPDSAFGTLAALLKVTDELDEARTMLERILRENVYDGAVPYVLSHLPQLELFAGNWDAAEERAQQHLDAALRTRQAEQEMQARYNLAHVALARGETDGVAELAEQLRTSGVEANDRWTERNGIGLQGMLAMARGHADEAARRFAEWDALAERMHLREPGYCRHHTEWVESLVALGRLDEAGARVDRLFEIGHGLERVSVVAGAHRVRALVRAARGDRATAVSDARHAVELFETTPLVVEHARVMLTLGQVLRRFKEKSAARDALRASLAVFERLGAGGFAERARQELARVGLRQSSGLSLTATERRVAELAATGRTVRQVGDELFISPKTVEANLTRAYRKLGLSGRAELAAWLAGGGADTPRG